MVKPADRADRPGRLLVWQVELERPLPELTVAPENSGYAGVFAILLRGGRPVGNLVAPLGPVGLRAAELARMIETVAGPGPAVTASGAAAGAVDAAGAVVDAEGGAGAEPVAWPTISVVIPTMFTRMPSLMACLDALAAQDYPAVEVVVVDNRPEQTEERAGLWRQATDRPGVRVVAQPLHGSSAARNRGIEVATGSVLTFVDDDALPAPGWLRAIGRRFATGPDIDAVTGLVLPKELETPAQIYFEFSGSKASHRYDLISFRAVGSSGSRVVASHYRPGTADRMNEQLSIYRAGHFGTGANMAFRASAIRALGGFDEALGTGVPALGGEELLLFMRLLSSGRRLVWDPDVVTYHHHIRQLETLRRTMVGYGCGFTAALTALVLANPRHLIGLARGLLAAPRLFMRKFARRRAAGQGAQPDLAWLLPSGYPAALTRAEISGLLVGPIRYLHSRATVRRWRRRLARGSA